MRERLRRWLRRRRQTPITIQAPTRAPLIAVELWGGPADGQQYGIPAGYGGPDGLPDAVAIWRDGRPYIYWRDGPLRYRWRDPTPAPWHPTRGAR